MNASVLAGITLGIALLGATLGVLNTWHSFYRDRLRVTVSPRKAFSKGREPRICFEIINRGYLPVTISGIGLRLRKPRHREFFAFIAKTIDGETLPQRLEPRTSITLFMSVGADHDPLIREATDAFVTTACGQTFRGNSQTLRSHIETLRCATKADDLPPPIT
jgi:hypothetical protein